MAFVPWKTSNDCIESIKRKISFPISQNTFSEIDLLRFANEEMGMSQVPNVLSFHEEYFVYSTEMELVPNVSRYPIPDRAIGMKLRDVSFKSTNGDLFEMTRVHADDKAYFQRTVGANVAIHKYYLEGNDVVLTPLPTDNPTGSLVFYFFLRPNQLVKNERACIIQSFVKTITIDNTTLIAGDTTTINNVVFTAVAGAPSTNEFQIGANSIISATNLSSAINLNGISIASNGTPSTNIISINFKTLSDSQNILTSNTLAFDIQVTQGIQFDQVPTTYLNPETNQNEVLYANNELIDFLQTKPGHRTYKFDIKIPTNGISGTTINFTQTDVPTNIILGDYICLANECIIPQIPPELHDALCERTTARVLAAIGDLAGLQVVNAKLQEVDARTGSLIDNRTEGSALKVTQRKSLLSFGKMGSRRRL